MTVVRPGRDRFHLVAAAFFEQRLPDHLDRHRAGGAVELFNRSDKLAVHALNGPAPRDILRACTDADLSNSGFPWLCAREIEVASQRFWAPRMPYAGSLAGNCSCHAGVRLWSMTNSARPESPMALRIAVPSR